MIGFDDIAFRYIPLTILIRMMPILDMCGYRGQEYQEWNSLAWEVATWHGALGFEMFEESLLD